MDRRIFLGVGTVAALDALVLEPRFLEVTEHEVPVHGLPRELDGFTIAHLTDVHLSSIGAFEERIADAIRKVGVELIALTGDVIDSSDRLDLLHAFCDLLPKNGPAVVATLGNWEHWAKIPPDSLRRTYSDHGAKLLVNESLVLGDGVAISATDDLTGGSPDLVRSLPSKDARARLLLTHSPRFFDDQGADAPRFALALAGHTHGGQIRITEHFAPFKPSGSGRYTSGFYDTPLGRAYVSRGIGTSIVPARFTCRPELPILRLRQG